MFNVRKYLITLEILVKKVEINNVDIIQLQVNKAHS